VLTFLRDPIDEPTGDVIPIDAVAALRFEVRILPLVVF
jgi:hypothetical protein